MLLNKASKGLRGFFSSKIIHFRRGQMTENYFKLSSPKVRAGHVNIALGAHPGCQVVVLVLKASQVYGRATLSVPDLV